MSPIATLIIIIYLIPPHTEFKSGAWLAIVLPALHWAVPRCPPLPPCLPLAHCHGPSTQVCTFHFLISFGLKLVRLVVLATLIEVNAEDDIILISRMSFLGLRTSQLKCEVRIFCLNS